MNPAEFKKIRTKLGLSQAELAEVFGLSGRLPITHYETGFRKPSALVVAVMRIFDEESPKFAEELKEKLKIQMLKIYQAKKRAARVQKT